MACGCVSVLAATISSTCGQPVPYPTTKPTTTFPHSPPPKDKTITAVAAAKRHTVVLTDRGEVWTWGHKQVNAVKVNLNNNMDLRQTPGGVDAPTLRFHRGHRDVLRPVAVAIAAGTAHSSVLTSTGSVLTWTSWELTTPATLVGGPLLWRKVAAIAAGVLGFCAQRLIHTHPHSIRWCNQHAAEIVHDFAHYQFSVLPCATPPLTTTTNIDPCTVPPTYTPNPIHRENAYCSSDGRRGRLCVGGPHQTRRPHLQSTPLHTHDPHPIAQPSQLHGGGGRHGDPSTHPHLE